MAFDGLSWYRLNRPVSEEEQAARLAIGQPASDTAKDERSVFSMSDTCLEVRDGNYSEKGWGGSLRLCYRGSVRWHSRRPFFG